ncbi:transcriptional repressor [Paenibacillus albicereus]|uniref:Transcriptional repressor n=1 Tax=Paenibacillus albicereus TaxID=2726185 RepID=A0A6H2GX19_9BACL|nr:Fur family transcriptional regulator [Paenibacillus albicereus]QJC51960.1 transcriptional repressor [Paenibacillus albicereus]
MAHTHAGGTAKEIVDAMARGGWRITEQRRRLAEIFAGCEGYLSPKDVYEAMTVHYPGVSFDTVYRNLRLMSEMGVLEQFYSMDAGLKFKAACNHHHHHHLICTNCEKTLTFDYCPMEQEMRLPGNFKIMNHRFEVYGLCEGCQSESGR